MRAPTSVAASLVLVLNAWACGGDVVVDDRADGSGGAGATTGSSPSTGSTTPTTSGPQPTTSGPQPNGTGPGPDCGCDDVCATANACGFVPDGCPEWCASLSPQVRNCICNTPQCELSTCFGGTGGSGGSGGGPNQCLACVTSLREGTCEAAAEDCQKNPECTELVFCHIDCGFTAPCVYECDAEHASVIGPAYSVLQCAICESCFGACQNGPTDIYCFFQ
jgi:hypothetical protein